MSPEPTPPDLAIRVRGLVRRFGDLEAVGGLDLDVRRGTCHGLLGPNGAGKTTTINILVGLDQPTSGEVSVLGRDWSKSASEIQERIGVQLQETQLVEKLTCREVLRVFASFYSKPRDPEELLAIVGLEEKSDARYKTLSGGQKQRLALGCSLVNHPEILFLDEPTTGLDPQARRRVWEIVAEFRDRGGTVLLTTHYMDEAQQLCDDIVIVDHGRSIAEGSPQAIIDSLGAESLIEFSVEKAGAAADATLFPAPDLEQLPGVARAQADGGQGILHVMAAHETIPALVASIRDRELALTSLQTHRPTLEDVFVSLTGRHLRDG